MNRIRTKGKQAAALAVFFSMLTALLAFNGVAKAAAEESGILVNVSAGFKGYMKQNEWYPVKLTLTNATEEDLKGELVISHLLQNTQASSDIVIPAVLPVGTAITVTASLPGEVLNKSNSKIRFYKDSFKSGNNVKLIGNDYISSKTANTHTIGVLSRDPDTLNFMPSLNQKGYDITVIPLVQGDLPTNAALLNSLDVLVINDTATASFDEQALKAVKDWVRLGGKLVLSGGVGYAKTAEGFMDIAPVEATGTSQMTNPITVNAADQTVIKLNSPVTVSVGTVIEGEIEQAEGGLPLAVSREIGFGTVIYVAFDPSLEPFSTSAGSAALWANLLQTSIMPIQPGAISNASDMFWNLNNVIDQFPSINPPNLTLLIVMFVLYMFVVAPLLYFIMSKTDRREWLWWLIPTTAVIVGISIFYIGAEDKRTKSAHTIEIIELTGHGDAVRSGAAAVFVPAGGTVKADFEEPLNTKPYSNNFDNYMLALDGKTQAVVRNESTSMIWREVPYWSTRKLWLDRRMMESDPGQMTLTYKRVNNDLEVSAKNDTDTDLSHVAVLIKGQAFKIGDLKRGESGTASIISSTMQQSGYYPYGQLLFPYPSGRTKDTFNRERSLLDSYANQNNGGIVSSNPMIVGFSTDHEPSFKVNGDRIKTDNLKFWIQTLETAFIDGNRSIVPAGIIQPVIKQNSLQRLENYGNGIYSISDGELMFEYRLPNSSKVAYDKLDITIMNGSTQLTNMLAVWNEKTAQWSTVQSAMAAPKEFFVGNEILRMKVTATGSLEMSMPLIAVEGEVQ
ncbi:hypothetical protein AB4Z29_04200 [Paenibacillus sp. 2TAB23]|uniref:DUF7408 domain-containing protein n=1 Tax=Paenibacillus sp. 2TAB23 TaxID=3233004 RepID=UPI003F9DD7C0